MNACSVRSQEKEMYLHDELMWRVRGRGKARAAASDLCAPVSACFSCSCPRFASGVRGGQRQGRCAACSAHSCSRRLHPSGEVFCFRVRLQHVCEAAAGHCSSVIVSGYAKQQHWPTSLYIGNRIMVDFQLLRPCLQMSVCNLSMDVPIEGPLLIQFNRNALGLAPASQSVSLDAGPTSLACAPRRILLQAIGCDSCTLCPMQCFRVPRPWYACPWCRDRSWWRLIRARCCRWL